MSKRLSGIIGCQDKTSSWSLIGFPNGVTLGQQHNFGKKPTVILYTYIDRHAGTPNKIRTKNTMSLDYSSICNIVLSIPQSGGKMSKRLDVIIGCKDKTSSWPLIGFPNGVTLGQQYNVGEKPTVTLYTYIDRHAGTDTKQNKDKRHDEPSLDYNSICNIGSSGWTRSSIRGGRGCNKFVSFLGENGTKIAPTGDIFDQSPGQMR